MRVVVAIGGNALLKRGEALEASIQQTNVNKAAKTIASMATQHEVVVVHGNGPQVGLLAHMAESYQTVKPYPLDILISESQGMIGYLLQQAIHNYLPAKKVTTILTQVEVNKADTAFTNPSKPIGAVYTAEEAQRLADTYYWQIAPDGDHYRRVVSSPEPQAIVELTTIRNLLSAGNIVICAGGGGIPVVRKPGKGLQGIEAVIDKDLTATLLASELQADVLIILTDIPFVEKNWHTPEAQPIHKATPEQLHSITFAPGSMAPKVTAACRFVEQTSKRAAIGLLEQGLMVLEGSKGTQILCEL